MSNYQARAEKILSRIQALAAISEMGSGIARRYGTAASAEAGRKVSAWMKEAGLEVREDAIGNIRGRWATGGQSDMGEMVDERGPAGTGKQTPRKTLVIGSHIDTVVNAGRWDGPLGVLAGLDIIEHMIGSGLRPAFDVELVAFCDEEGVRYHTTYLGSKVLAGSFDREMLERKDGEGVRLEEAIRAIGGDPDGLERDAMPSERWLGYFEMHIEQGPVLYESGIPVAAVRAIAGQVRAEVIFKGMAGHAGTVPMNMRKDALAGGAEFVLAVERLAGEAGSGLVATVGKLHVTDAASNVIPGEVVCSVDIRSADTAVLERGHVACRELCEGIGMRRGLEVGWKVVQTSPPVTCDSRMIGLLEKAMRKAGYETPALVSGAGHDAVAIAAVAPVCMMFVRCYKGISHHPEEDVDLSDLAAAIAVADEFLYQLTEIWKYPH